MRKSKMPVDTKRTSHFRPADEGGTQNVQLPPVSIDSMTQGQLRDFIPYLLRIVERKAIDKNKGNKPHWWPSDIPWSATRTDAKEEEVTRTESLRSIVRSCYKHLGQESALKKGVCATPKVKMVIANNYPLLQSHLKHTRQPVVMSEMQRSGKPYAEIYICFFCEKEFLDRNEMRNHQENCKDRPPTLQAVRTPPRSLTLSPKGPPPAISPNPKLNLNMKLNRPTKEVFIKLLNMVPKQKAEKIRASHRKSMEIDCEKIDIDEPLSPLSPTTPRTPKSLMSQLSRDESFGTSKKRLSYSEPMDNSDKDSVASGGNDDNDDRPGTGRSGKSLLTIDVTSFLGQRIQKHIQTEATLTVIPNAEQFCRTPVKNDVMEKLRNRTVTFPTTYKPRKRSNIRNVHQYQFTKRQKREFLKKVTTGLNKHSQGIAKSIPKSKVLLDRLTDKQLKRWLSNFMYRKWKGIKNTNPAEESTFPKVPLLMSKDVDKLLGLKKKSRIHTGKTATSTLSLVNVVSEDVNAETSKQKFTLYRCLLSDIAAYSAFYDGQNLSEFSEFDSFSSKKNSSSKSKQIKKSNASVKTSQVIPISFGYSHGQKILNNKSDDDISILSVSSDEESLKSSCCLGCRKRKQCRCTPDPFLPCSSVSPTPATTSLLSEPVGSFCASTALPLDVPLKIMPYNSPSIKSPYMSPCSCISSPSSDTDVSLRMLPSPSISSTKSSSGIAFGNVCFSVKPLKPVNTPELAESARRTRSSLPTDLMISKFSLNGKDGENKQFESEESADYKKVDGISLRSNKSVSVQLPLTDLQSEMSLPPSPSSSSSAMSSKDSPSSVKKKLDINLTSASTAQRRSPRGPRSESVDFLNSNSSESPKVFVRKSVSTFTPLCLRSGSVSNAEVFYDAHKKESLSNNNSQLGITRIRRSKRLLSSPTSSPNKLRRLETT